MTTFRDKKPSLLASAIIYQARKDEITKIKKKSSSSNEIQSYWCPELQSISGYSE